MTEVELLVHLAEPSLTAEEKFQYVSYLGDLATELSTPLLTETLRSDLPKLRYATIRALGHVGGAREVELLVSALQSDDEYTVFWAADRLSSARDRSALRQSLPDLVRCLDGHSGRLVAGDRWAVVKAIAAARTPEAVDVLARCALEPRGSTRREAAIGLMLIDNDASQAALHAAVSRLSYRRGKYARRALDRRFPPRVERGKR